MATASRSVLRRGSALLAVLLILVAAGVLTARFLGVGPGAPARPAPPGEHRGGAEVPAPSGPGETPPSSRARLPEVLIYHTHGTENYAPEPAHAPGRPGQITEVGRALAEALNAAGIRTLHTTQLHDYPDWERSYANSRETVRQVLAANDGIRAVIDVHRDALPEVDDPRVALVDLGGKPTARILFVVGDLSNANTEENLAFAEAVRAKLDQLYPGVSRGVRIQHDDYNGNLHPNALQVFIGEYRHTTAEQAIRAAELL
ncbi:MAG TPA: stage II sporulation protein P, partial [Limnochorda sp.]